MGTSDADGGRCRKNYGQSQRRFWYGAGRAPGSHIEDVRPAIGKIGRHDDPARYRDRRMAEKLENPLDRTLVQTSGHLQTYKLPRIAPDDPDFEGDRKNDKANVRNTFGINNCIWA